MIKCNAFLQRPHDGAVRLFPGGTLTQCSSEQRVRAQAARRAAAGGGFESIFLPIIAMFAVLYFLMIRPANEARQRAQAMVEALQKGDEVVTAGGLAGEDHQRRRELRERRRSRSNVEIQVQRAAVQTVLPKGTIKTSDERQSDE